jgi:DNA repair photolyase
LLAYNRVVETVAARTILTPTGGFLLGFTHTLNPYRGCAFGRALCGVYCYASETRYGKDRARAWGSYLLAKESAADLYRADAGKVRAKGGALRIFMASVTDPYVPQERTLGVTRSILEAMVELPPDLLVLQTHTPGPLRDRDLLVRLPAVVQITVETDRERIAGLPPHATPLEARLEALRELGASGVKTVAVASPLLPLEDPRRFARALGASARGVILDHWALGDGSIDGARTRRERAHAALPLPRALEAAGLGEWNTLETFRAVVAVFEEELGAARVGVSQEGFRRACSGWPG